MSAGLIIYNENNELAVLAESRGTSVAGKATYVVTTQPTSSESGGSTYTFQSGEPCMFILDCSQGYVGVIDMKYENGLYTIGVYSGQGQNAYGFDIQVPIDVWAVSMISGAPSTNYGLVMYNSAGQLTHDFSRPNVTFPVSAGSINESASSAGLTRPVVMGNSPYHDVTFFDHEDGTYTKTDYRSYLVRRFDNTIGYSARKTYEGRFPGVPPSDSTITDLSPFVVMEGALLP